jgi:AraC-like DNA-binding protein
LSNGGEIIFKGATHPLIPGWLYLIAPHTVFDSDCIRPFRKWYIHFTIAGLSHPHGPGIVRIRPTARMQRLLAQTCPATNRAGQSPTASPNALATIELVVLALESAFAEQKAWPAANQRVVNCIGLMRERLKEKLTLHSLARFVGTSPRTLTQMFVTETGFPPNRYLIELRLNHAMCLLRHTSESIEQIADECGFGNRYYFTRMFTKYRQVTPVSFRKTRQGNHASKPQPNVAPCAKVENKSTH